ncbi:MAG: endonuclease III domain-containing protein [Pauljensenia sp.]
MNTLVPSAEPAPLPLPGEHPPGATVLEVSELPDALRSAVGPQSRWWTVESPFEILLGCVLVQNTNWRNVERSLGFLRRAGVTSPDRLLATDVPELVALVVPSGFQNAKGRALRGLCAWWVDEGGADALQGPELYAASPALTHLSTPELRRELLALRGIGPETADVLMLYLLGRGVFVADTYARRLFGHLGWQVPSGYDAFATRVQGEVELSLEGWQEFHALIDEFAKVHTRTPEDWQAGPLAGCVLVP